MNFLVKIIKFFKNFHPIKSFSRPIDKKESSINVTTSFEALTRELTREHIVTNEPTHITHESEETITVHELGPKREMEEYGVHSNVIILPTLEKLPESEISLYTPEIIVPERIVDFVIAEVAPHSEPQKKTRVKRKAKTKKITHTRTRRKKAIDPVPPEAMGFGF